MLRPISLAFLQPDRQPGQALRAQFNHWREKKVAECRDGFRCHNAQPDRLVLDARNDPTLLQVSGQLRVFNETVRSLQQRREPLPKAYRLTLILPDLAWQRHLEKSVASLNRLVKPEGVVDSLKHWAFRKAVSFQGTLHPVVMAQGRQPHEVVLTLNLSELRREDLVKFASFVNSYPRK